VTGHVAEPAIIETDLQSLPRALPVNLDPLTAALRTLGYTSISTGLRTAQVDGKLYDLDAEAQAVITRWLDGDPSPSRGTVRLLRRQLGRRT
jgi:hypothetical protein